MPSDRLQQVGQERRWIGRPVGDAVEGPGEVLGRDVAAVVEGGLPQLEGPRAAVVLALPGLGGGRHDPLLGVEPDQGVEHGVDDELALGVLDEARVDRGGRDGQTDPQRPPGPRVVGLDGRVGITVLLALRWRVVPRAGDGEQQRQRQRCPADQQARWWLHGARAAGPAPRW
jgi:hypothetical protein